MADRREDPTRPRWGDLPEAERGFQAGSEFAGHRIEAEIGRGGMGVVYRALHLALDQRRALKVVAPALSDDASFRERFRRESRLAAAIEHPSLIPVHHAGEENGRLFLSMRLVEGADLHREVAANGPLAPERAVRVIVQAAGALDAAHAAGLVHRDVKPANLLLEPGAGAGERVFLTDFGISRTATGAEPLTATGEFLGSPDYVAPEQITSGDADARSDIYALGGVLHFALTGHPPFERRGDMAKLYAHVNAPRPRPSEVAPSLPSPIDRVVAKAMAIEASERFTTATEFSEAAADALRHVEAPASGRRPSGRARAEEAPTGELRRPRGRTAAAGVAIAAILGAAAGVVLPTGDEEDGGNGATSPPESRPRVVNTIPVGGDPTGLTVGADEVWIAAADPNSVHRIDPGRNRTARVPTPISGRPRSVAVGFGSAWVALGAANEVLRIDPGQAVAPTRIPVNGGAGDLAVDDDWVWVANESGNAVTRIDPEANEVSEVVPVGNGPRGLATGEGAVWVTNIADGTLSKIDPAEAKTVGRPVEVGQRPSDVAVGGGSVWAMDNFGGTVVSVDPRTLDAGNPIPVDDKPRGLKFGFGYLWVASGGEDSVGRIDPATQEPVGPRVSTGDEPADIAIGRGAVWTSNSGAATVTRIDPR